MANKLATYYTELDINANDLVDIIRQGSIYTSVARYLHSKYISFENDFVDVLEITSWDDGSITSRVTKITINVKVE